MHFVAAVFEASGPTISKPHSCRKVLGIAEAVPFVARSEDDIIRRHRDFAALDEMNAAAFNDVDEFLRPVMPMKHVLGAGFEGALPDDQGEGGGNASVSRSRSRAV